ncbi:DUF2628 domain-containing protein [Comamonas nitrativorans]|uniref:DUF2628 domain-containing protein n=1 Tax=Comamonas nitrativorans TaxID=108437 RepID=A0ABV9GXU0_9BURK
MDDNAFPRNIHSTLPAAADQPPRADDAIRQFVGKKADYYLGKWVDGGNSFNVAGFFLGPAWLLYRKMYRPAGLILAALLIETMLEIILFPDMSESTSTALSRAIGLGVAGLIGTFGNGWYKTHVEKAVSDLQAIHAPAESYVRQGGTSWAVAILGSLGFLLLLFLVIAALLPEGY